MDDDIKLELLKKKYSTQKELFDELSLLIDKKIKYLYDEENIQLSKLERNKDDKLEEVNKLKSKIERDEERIAIEFQRILNDEKEFENNIINPPNLDEIKKNIQVENQSIMDDIKVKQKYNTILNTQRQEILQSQQNDLLKIKVQLKSNLLTGEEREKYLKEKIKTLENDYTSFITKCNQYLENCHDKKSDINETIEILREDINNKSINKKLERTKLSNFNKEFLKDKRQNKKYVMKASTETGNMIEEKEILLTNQSRWREEKRNIHDKSLNELKIVINHSETIIKELEIDISKTEYNLNLKTNTDDDIKWGLRRQLGELKQKLMLEKDTYQSSLIELNNLQTRFLKEIENDPFKNEIKKLGMKIDKNQITINKIKSHETSMIEKDKQEHIENKNRLQKNRLEIKNLSDELEGLELDIKIFEVRFEEDKKIREDKLNTFKNELIEHHKYIEQFKQQSRNDTNDIIQSYKTKISDHELLIKQNTDEITTLKNKSTTILKNFDILMKKCNQDKDAQQKMRLDFQKRKNKLELEKKQLNDTISRYETSTNKFQEYVNNEYVKYFDDIKFNTIQKIQELHKNLNDSESELKKLDLEIKHLEKIVTEEFFIIHDTNNEKLLNETNNEILEIEKNVSIIIDDNDEEDINNFESFLNLEKDENILDTNLETESVLDSQLETESVFNINLEKDENVLDTNLETESVLDSQLETESVFNINLEKDESVNTILETE